MKGFVGIAAGAALMAGLATSAAASPYYGHGHGWRHHRHHGYGHGYRQALVPVVFEPDGDGARAVRPAVLLARREPYIGYGLVYNVPPEPVARRWRPYRHVVRAKY